MRMNQRERQRAADFDIPTDGYGAGYSEFRMREAFADLVGIYGREGARQIAAEIMDDATRREQQ